MSRTTDQWEQLLEGATPGPWRWYWDNGIISLEGAETVPIATDLNVWDSDVLAAAPEAVAEVVRLRRELEAQAAAYQYMANQIEAATSQAGMVGRPIMAEHYAERAKDLTRILNQEGK